MLVVLQERDGLGGCPSGQLAVRPVHDDFLRFLLVHIGILKQSQPELQGEDPAYRFVDPFLGHLFLLDQLDQILGKSFGVQGNHRHVDAGIDADPDRLFVCGGDSMDGVQFDNVLPIGDDDSLKAELFPEHVG